MLTLDDCQEDHNDKKEEGDVKNHAIDFIFITRRVLNLVSDTTSCSHSYIHVEHVALEEKKKKHTHNKIRQLLGERVELCSNR